MTTVKNHRYIIADHIRAISFIVNEGVMPAGKGRGYILRRLVRRTFSSMLALGIAVNNIDFYNEILDTIISTYSGVYDELATTKESVLTIITAESVKYQKAIATGESEWRKILG
jgi:alanyl-tRNA synthetase